MSECVCEHDDVCMNAVVIFQKGVTYFIYFLTFPNKATPFWKVTSVVILFHSLFLSLFRFIFIAQNCCCFVGHNGDTACRGKLEWFSHWSLENGGAAFRPGFFRVCGGHRANPNPDHRDRQPASQPMWVTIQRTYKVMRSNLHPVGNEILKVDH